MLPVLLNPAARRATRVHAYLHAFLRAGLHPTLTTATRDDQLDDLAAHAAGRGARVIAAAGGDGTLGLVATALTGTGIALAVLPLGTGNTFARNLHVPRHPRALARAIVQGRTRDIDVGIVQGRAFLNSVTLGVSSGVARALRGGIKRRLGLLAYPLVGLPALVRERPRTYDLTLDGRPLRLHTAQLILANADDVARRLRIPGADYEDGQLVLVSVRGRTPLGLLLHGLRWWFGDTRALRVQRFRTLHLRAHDGAPLTANIDGDLLSAPALHVEVRARALRVVAADPHPQGPFIPFTTIRARNPRR
ncbi:diacylglycerol/lipid kinase family protein [Deinococcus maricopensis]|uniref:Diacylglycerol kinase catalytic region n=1 Tax=Deinococcus maricopensis (strain DSM 21211 / LMG 22137 / NRRL B-23946 / LB-34) TaxID=709986 RepID=E8U8X9_DEIML|nr:diacylglycerol kinase family protein [Deinococcus maricopensis]ADV67518.1 diacylglycerol kinase catalytic region [Deinococcus maricopensis DSM 21211]